jgi:hypothetical protein
MVIFNSKSAGHAGQQPDNGFVRLFYKPKRVPDMPGHFDFGFFGVEKRNKQKHLLRQPDMPDIPGHETNVRRHTPGHSSKTDVVGFGCPACLPCMHAAMSGPRAPSCPRS